VTSRQDGLVAAQRQRGRRALGHRPFHINTVQTFEYMRVSGTPHSWSDAQRAWDHGRMSQWTTYKNNHAMAYFGEKDMPFQYALANAFTICDAYHCASQTGTNTNRLFQWTGTNDGLGQGNGPATYNDYDWFDADNGDGGYTWTTYPERLEAAGVSWQVYENMDDNFTDNPLAGFHSFRDAWFQRPGYSEALRQRGVSTRDLDKLKEDVLNGTLPQVSFIIATAEGSEPRPLQPRPGRGIHRPGAGCADRQPGRLEPDRAVPELRRERRLLRPRAAAGPAVLRELERRPGAGRAGRRQHRGHHGRVPRDPGQLPRHAQRGRLLHRPTAWARACRCTSSPWSKGGWVNSQVFDHTSVLQFIEKRFG
jgi:phospholipase C